MDINNRAWAIVSDYNRLYGAKCSARFVAIDGRHQNPDWGGLGEIQEEMSHKLVDGIVAMAKELIAEYAPAAEVEVGELVTDFEKADEPKDIPAPKPKRGHFIARERPTADELFEKCKESGMTIYGLCKHYGAQRITVKKWLEKSNIKWEKGTEPVRFA